MKKKLFRDESTPDRKEIWAKVEQAASRVAAATASYPSPESLQWEGKENPSESRTYRHGDALQETISGTVDETLES